MITADRQKYVARLSHLCEWCLADEMRRVLRLLLSGRNVERVVFARTLSSRAEGQENWLTVEMYDWLRGGELTVRRQMHALNNSLPAHLRFAYEMDVAHQQKVTSFLDVRLGNPSLPQRSFADYVSATATKMNALTSYWDCEWPDWLMSGLAAVLLYHSVYASLGAVVDLREIQVELQNLTDLTRYCFPLGGIRDEPDVYVCWLHRQPLVSCDYS